MLTIHSWKLCDYIDTLNFPRSLEGCYEILILQPVHSQDKIDILKNTVEECYLECQERKTSCKQNQPMSFTVKGSICFCVCNIQNILSHSNKCNESCFADSGCNADNYFNVYTKYAMEYKRSDGFCLVCSKAHSTNLDFGCDAEHFGLCAKNEEICFGIQK